MKPAICGVCGRFQVAGDWVEFQDYDESQLTSLTHPAGLEFFCNEHLGEALKLASQDESSALNALKMTYLSDSAV